MKVEKHTATDDEHFLPVAGILIAIIIVANTLVGVRAGAISCLATP